MRAEDEEGQPNTEDAHTTEKQKQSPSPPNRRAAPSSLQRPLLLRGELHPPSWRICWGIPSLPQLSSPSLPMLKLRRRLSRRFPWCSTNSSLCGPSAGGERMRWCIPAFQVGQAILLFSGYQCLCRKSLLYCRGYCDCPMEYTHTRACPPAPVHTQEVAYCMSIHQLLTGSLYFHGTLPLFHCSNVMICSLFFLILQCYYMSHTFCTICCWNVSGIQLCSIDNASCIDCCIVHVHSKAYLWQKTFYI